MKETRTKTIAQILCGFEEEKRKEIVEVFDNCVQAICCEEIAWENFEVFEPSCKDVKKILKSLTPEYIMTICDKVNLCDVLPKVKITILHDKKETSISTINLNIDTMLIYVSISNKRWAEIEKKIQED